MKRIIWPILLMMTSLTLTGCSANSGEDDDDFEPQEVEVVMAEGYTLSNKCKGIAPFGCTALENSVIICDVETSCLREFDLQGNETGKVGQLGNEKGEFVRPTGLTYCNDKLYVIDSGNNRIQIFDKNMEYQSEYALDGLEESAMDMTYTDIAASTAGIVTIVTNSVFAENCRVYTSDLEGVIHKTRHILNGYADCEENRLYCANTYTLSKSSSSFGGRIKESVLYELVDADLHTVFTFPSKYGPTDFVIDGDDVYVLSCVWARLDHFNIDGSYIETIWEFDSLFPESWLTRTSEGGFVVTDKFNKVAYFISHDSD